MEFEYSDDYARAFGDLAEGQFRNRFFPKEAAEGWESLIQAIRKGYDDVPPEYDHDVQTARDPLGSFLVDDTLNKFPEHQVFKQIIDELDKQFIALTQVRPESEHNSREWWNNRVPKHAGRAYTDFFNPGN